MKKIILVVLSTFLLNVAVADTAEASKLSRIMQKGFDRLIEHIEKHHAEEMARIRQASEQQDRQPPKEMPQHSIDFVPISYCNAEEFGERLHKWSETNPQAYGRISEPTRMPDTIDKNGDKLHGCIAAYSYDNSLGSLMYKEDSQNNVDLLTVVAKDRLTPGLPVTNVVMHTLESEMAMDASERILLMASSEVRYFSYVKCKNGDTVILNTAKDNNSSHICYRILRAVVR